MASDLGERIFGNEWTLPLDKFGVQYFDISVQSVCSPLLMFFLSDLPPLKILWPAQTLLNLVERLDKRPQIVVQICNFEEIEEHPATKKFENIYYTVFPDYKHIMILPNIIVSFALQKTTFFTSLSRSEPALLTYFAACMTLLSLLWTQCTLPKAPLAIWRSTLYS